MKTVIIPIAVFLLGIGIGVLWRDPVLRNKLDSKVRSIIGPKKKRGKKKSF